MGEDQRVPPLVSLSPIDPALAQRIVARDERPGDAWHPAYPFVDELDPLRGLATASASEVDPVFGMYVVRRASDGLAVGGAGFFGPPSDLGEVEIGYGLVEEARGAGLASAAVRWLLDVARAGGARVVVAGTPPSNVASQRVLLACGFTEIWRSATDVRFRLVLTDPGTQRHRQPAT